MPHGKPGQAGAPPIKRRRVRPVRQPSFEGGRGGKRQPTHKVVPKRQAPVYRAPKRRVQPVSPRRIVVRKGKAKVVPKSRPKAAPFSLLDVRKGRKFVPSVPAREVPALGRQTKQFRSQVEAGKLPSFTEDTGKRIKVPHESFGHKLGKQFEKGALDALGTVPGLRESKLLSQGADVVGRKKVQLGLEKLSRASTKLSKAAASSGGYKGKSAGLPGGKFGEKLLQQTLDIPAQTVTSSALTGLAVGKALQGKPKELGYYTKQFKEHDPVALAAQGKLGRAAKEAKANPVATALELSGVKAGVGRGLGAAGRAAGVKAASTERAPLHLYPKDLGEGPKLPRRYSRDIFNKALQVGGETVKRKVRGREPNVAYPKSELLPGRPRPKLAKRVNVEVYGNEAARRLAREKTATQTAMQAPPSELAAAVKRRRVVKKGGVKLKDHQTTAPYLIAEGTVRTPKTIEADLIKHRDRLNTVFAEEGKRWTYRERKSNRDEVKVVDKLLADKNFLKDPSEAFKGAKAFAKDQNARSKREVSLGARTEAELNARLTPYAIAHMDARFNPKTKRLEAVKTATPGQRFELPPTMKSIARAQKRAKLQSGVKPRAEPLRTGKPEAMPLGGPRAREVTPADIKRHMQANGVHPEDIAHISHRPEIGNVFNIPTRRGMKAPYPISRHRTGEAYRRGTRAATPEAMTRQAVESQGIISAIENFQRDVNNFSIKPGGSPKRSWGQAERVGHELTHHPEGHPQAGQLKSGHVELVPMNIAPLKAVKEQLSTIRENTAGAAEPSEQLADTLSEAAKRAFEKPGSGKGEFVLVPKDVRDLWLDHQFRASPSERSLQKVASLWKHVVLTTAAPISWLTSNVLDLGIRSAAEGLHPGNVRDMRKVVSMMHDLEQKGHVPKGETDRFVETHLGGSFYKSSALADTYRPSPVSDLPVFKQVSKSWRGYYSTVFRGEGVLEKLPQFAKGGKMARQEIRRDWSTIRGVLRNSDEQLRNYARGLGNDPDKQHQIGEGVMQVVGNWGKRSPEFRRFLMDTGPFAQWLAVALRYVYVTLPVHHPIKTGILGGLYQMTDEERRKLGLTLYPAKGKDRLADYQQGGVPGGRGIIRFQAKTSFGMSGQIGSQGLAGVTGFVYPQFQSAFKALNGQAWTGEPLQYAPGTPKAGQNLEGGLGGDKDKIAAYLLVEGFLPFIGMGRRILEKGGSSHPTSTIFSPKVWDKKKQTGYFGGAGKTFNPFPSSKAVKKKQFQPKGSSGSGGSSGGGGGWKGL